MGMYFTWMHTGTHRSTAFRQAHTKKSTYVHGLQPSTIESMDCSGMYSAGGRTHSTVATLQSGSQTH